MPYMNDKFVLLYFVFFPTRLAFYLFSQTRLIDSMLEHQFPTRRYVYLDILSTNNNIRCTCIRETKY